VPAPVLSLADQARLFFGLITMLIMETLFGLPGVAAAPICYAYLKTELIDRGLV
jgi:hypothetical protein